jgi:hypothetical protein
MVQCPNCKCQVGTGVRNCPYCGTLLPVEQEKQTQKVYYNQEYFEQPTYQIPVNPTYQIPQVPQQTEFSNPIPPVYYDTGKRADRETMFTVLIALVIGLVIANFLELAAILMLLI